jgi:hypothetical protein
LNDRYLISKLGDSSEAVESVTAGRVKKSGSLALSRIREVHQIHKPYLPGKQCNSHRPATTGHIEIEQVNTCHM